MNKREEGWISKGFSIIGTGVSRNWKAEADDLEKQIAEQYSSVAREVFINRAGGNNSLVEYNIWGKLISGATQIPISNVSSDLQDDDTDTAVAHRVRSENLIEYYKSAVSGKWVVKIHDTYDQLIDIRYFPPQLTELEFSVQLDKVIDKYEPATVNEVIPERYPVKKIS